MKNDAVTALVRLKLDEVFKKWRHVPAAVPRRGWIYDIREALGMTGGDLARRMNISISAITLMEQSEAKGGIRLATLRRAARALDCTLVYALVPRQPLEKIIQRRRRNIALEDLSVVLKTKAGDEYRDLISAYAQTIKRNRLWRKI